ncbi:MAG: FliR [Planctomycetaceae bacterium]|nr:FliR [Planctomycetaceae bacterium]
MISEGGIGPAELAQFAMRMLAEHLLVFCRLLGLLVLIPGISTAALGWQLRAVLLITLAAIITPNVSRQVQAVLDPDTIQQASREEFAIPDLNPAESGELAGQSASKQTVQGNSISELAHAALAELCLGLMLGCGANLVLQSFRMAGSVIEQQTGLSLGQTGGPESEDGETGSGSLMFVFGGVLFLVAGGHLLCISTLLDTFQEFPVGYGSIASEPAVIIANLVHQSLKLALQLASPIIATQLLVSYTLAHAGNLAPQFNTNAIASPVRIVSACIVLSLTLTGMTERILDTIPVMLQIPQKNL